MEKDRNARIKSALVEYNKKISASAAEARKTLIREGMYTESGTLTKQYRLEAPEKS